MCLKNKAATTWASWFLRNGSTVSRAGSATVVLGATVDAIPTPPTWISGSTGVAIGGGMVAVGTAMQAVGVGLLASTGNQRGAFQAGVGMLLAAPQPDISALAPLDPTDATAAYTASLLYGPDACPHN